MNVLKALFCEQKKDGLGFSTKKFFAVFFCVLAIAEKIILVVFPESHFSVSLSKAGLSESVIITLIGSMDGMAFAALAVYGWSKANGAA